MRKNNYGRGQRRLATDSEEVAQYEIPFCSTIRPGDAHGA
jgi:hypothetical protein